MTVAKDLVENLVNRLCDYEKKRRKSLMVIELLFGMLIRSVPILLAFKFFFFLAPWVSYKKFGRRDFLNNCKICAGMSLKIKEQKMFEVGKLKISIQ